MALLDLTIPGDWGGRAIAQEVRRSDPQIALIATSGYSEDAVLADPAKFGFTAKLSKPYRKVDLARTLQAVAEGLGQQTPGRS